MARIMYSLVSFHLVTKSRRFALLSICFDSLEVNLITVNGDDTTGQQLRTREFADHGMMLSDFPMRGYSESIQIEAQQTQ
jgi:hypothetical protein